MENPETDVETPVFEWALNRTMFINTIFGKKKMVEYTEIKKVYGFIQNEMGISYQGIKRYDHLAKVDKTELDQIKRFRDLYNRKLKAFQTAFFLPKHKWGRIIPANEYLSLSIFHRPTRHSFCDGIYVDIDIVNAQPTAIFEIAKQNNISLPTLAKYVKNPKKYREFIMEHHNVCKDGAKNLPIVIMMGGSYNGWIKEWDIQKNETNLIKNIVELEKELKGVMDIIWKDNQHIKRDVLKQDPQRWKDINEMKRGVMGLWCQSVERLFQETAISYLVKSKDFKLEHIVPCQDGFMILKELWYNDILIDCEKVIKDKFGVSLKFLNKPFDEKIEIPNVEEINGIDEWDDLISVKRLADTFVNEFGKYFCRENQSIYIYRNNRWYDETDTKEQNNLVLYISENLYNIMSVKISSEVSLKDEDRSRLLKELRYNTSNGTKMNDIIKHIKAKIVPSDIEFNSNPFLLGFTNGVYDLLKGEFRQYKYDDYITLTTKYEYVKPDYNDVTTQTIKKEVNEIFNSIQPDLECQKLYLQILASGLDGKAYQKLFLFNGQGGNGKGLTGSLMSSILGEYYTQPSNGLLKDVEKSNVPSPDMINLKGKRYINFTEVTGSIRVSMLRNLTGGGKFVGRYLNKNPQEFSMSATIVMEFNTSPDFDGKPERADYRRLIDLLFPVNFTDDEDKIGKVIGGVLYMRANVSYTSQSFIQKIKMVFLDILLDTYKASCDGDNGIKFDVPASVKQRTEVFIENQNLFQKVMNSVWQKVEINLMEDGSQDPEDLKLKTIKVKDVWDSITFSDEYKGLSYRNKRQYGRDEFYKWIEGVCAVSGNSKTGKLIIGWGRKTDYDVLDKVDEEEV
jgi:hypothetical protein